MASSFFLIPLETVVIGGKTRTQEKYIPALNPTARAIVPFGTTAICWADLTTGQVTSVSANADVVTIPPLDNTIGAGALAQVKTQIETLNMPAQWVQTGMTYRTVLRVLVGMAQLIQRMTFLLGQPVTIPGNLDKTMSQFSAAVQSAVATACDQLGIDRTNITGATTLREALRDFGQQFIAGQLVHLGDL